MQFHNSFIAATYNLVKPNRIRFKSSQVLYFQHIPSSLLYSAAKQNLFRTCHELICTSCLSGFPISSSESPAGLRSAPVDAKRSSTGRAASRYDCVFFLDFAKPSCAICIDDFMTVPDELPEAIDWFSCIQAERNALSAMNFVNWYRKHIQKQLFGIPAPECCGAGDDLCRFLQQKPHYSIAFCFRDRKQRTERLAEIGKTGRQR